GYLADQLAPYDEMAVVSFGRVVRPLQQLTGDKRLMKDAVMSLQAYGASALYDGIAVGMHESASGIGRQVVVVVSDGREQDFPHKRKRLSMDTVPNLIDAARHHGINVYTIGIGKRVDHEALEVLARETGGLYLQAPRAESLRELFARMAESFQSSYQAVYQSPNIKEDKLVRGGLVKVHFLGLSGAAPYRFTVRPQTAVSSLAIQRTAVWKEKFARLRVYTRGERETWLDMEFSLVDSHGKTVRQGRTTRDGYGSSLGGGMPELLELEPGRYTLEIRQPGTDLVFHHPGILLERGRSTDLTFNYSRLVFRRNGSLWYDTEHALGETSDLLDLSVEDLAARRVIRSGSMSAFKRPRDVTLWLEDGAYRIRLDNLLGDAKLASKASRDRRLPGVLPGVEASVLRNALTAEVVAQGGDVVFFDVAYDDFLLDRDPRLVPDELPDAPRTGEEPPMNPELANAGRPHIESHLDELRDELEPPPVEKTAAVKVSGAQIRAARRHHKATVKSHALPITAHDRDAKPKSAASKVSAAKPKPAPAAKPASEKKPALGSEKAKESKQSPAPKSPDELLEEAPAESVSNPEPVKGKAADAIASAPGSRRSEKPGVLDVSDKCLADLSSKKASDTRPSGSASSRDESDGSVYVSPGGQPAAPWSSAPSKAAEVPLARGPSKAETIARPSPSDPIAEDEILAKLERVRASSRARRATSSNALTRLEKLAGN
ncbi:MAG: VWA domain-containing protein, partial [Candidatus Wallbacteria bacterium]|nr:VWA domain-containing protein [Candidatus Wallbacteria bacterium]